MERSCECILLGSTVRPLPIKQNCRETFLTRFCCSRVGVGFSYADYGEAVATTEDAAKDIHAFVSIFFDTFKEFKGRKFHMSGESYGVS